VDDSNFIKTYLFGRFIATGYGRHRGLNKSAAGVIKLYFFVFNSLAK
jgi:hypothetical protein